MFAFFKKNIAYLTRYSRLMFSLKLGLVTSFGQCFYRCWVIYGGRLLACNCLGYCYVLVSRFCRLECEKRQSSLKNKGKERHRPCFLDNCHFSTDTLMTFQDWHLTGDLNSNLMLKGM